MRIFRTEEYLEMKNPTPGEKYRLEILRHEHNAKDLGGIDLACRPQIIKPIPPGRFPPMNQEINFLLFFR